MKSPNHPTREKILKAAIELMWQHGYRRTSPAHVMQASGVGQGSFYHHFADKRSLGLAVVEHIVLQTNESLDEIFARGPRAPGTLSDLGFGRRRTGIVLRATADAHLESSGSRWPTKTPLFAR